MRDAKINQIFEGTNQIQRIWSSPATCSGGKPDVQAQEPFGRALTISRTVRPSASAAGFSTSQPMALVRGLIRRAGATSPGAGARQHRAGHADRRRLRRRDRMRVHQLRAVSGWRRISGARPRPAAIKMLRTRRPGDRRRPARRRLRPALRPDPGHGTDLPRVNPEGLSAGAARRRRAHDARRCRRSIPTSCYCMAQQADEHRQCPVLRPGYSSTC